MSRNSLKILVDHRPDSGLVGGWMDGLMYGDKTWFMGLLSLLTPLSEVFDITF